MFYSSLYSQTPSQCLTYSMYSTAIWSIEMKDITLSKILNSYLGTSLVVQWLRLCTSNAGGPGSIPGQGTRSYMLQLRPGAPK